jgi:hypothetical protein
MATSFFKRCGSFLQRITSGRFPYLLIVEEAAILIVMYLAVVGITHFRVEAVAAGAAVATLVLTFLRHVAESRNLTIGKQEPDAARELPGNAVSHEHEEPGEGDDVTLVVVLVVTRAAEG